MDRTEDVRRRLGEELPRIAARHEVPGVSAAVLVDGEVVESVHGALNLRTGVEVTPNALFMIQSITKIWTATLVMQLVDDGAVALDSAVRTYLPTFRTADETAGATITVRHLLTHSGGFEGDIWAATTSGDDALERFVEDLVPLARQVARPGEMYSYCNAGYGVLGRMVEVLRGMPYASAVRHHLADPLGIDEIAFSADEALAFPTAIGHTRADPDVALQPLTRWALLPPSNPAAGNQLAMSARALMAFARLHLADGVAPDGTRLLSTTSSRMMRARQLDHPADLGAGGCRGLGWTLTRTPPFVEHGGDAPGVAALLRTAPDAGVAVVVLTNGGAADLLERDLVDPLLRDLTGAAPPASPSRTRERRPVPELERYVGRYQTRQLRYDVSVEDVGLLRVAVSARHEGLAMTRAAGLPVRTSRYELQQVHGEVFALVDSRGAVAGAVEFLGSDGVGRARFLHGGRAAPRVERDDVSAASAGTRPARP